MGTNRVLKTRLVPCFFYAIIIVIIKINMWLTFAIIGYSCLAVVGILDKFIVTKTLDRPSVYVFYSGVIMIPLLFLLPFDFINLNIRFFDWGIILLSGLAFAFSLFFLFNAFKISEVSHAGPLAGATTPLFSLILGFIFLNEVLEVKQYLAITILIAGSLLISFEKSKLHSGWHKGMLFAIGAGFFSALYYVCAKHVYDIHGFFTGIVLTLGFAGLFGSLFIFYPQVFKEIFKKKKNKKKKSVSQNKILMIGTNKIFAFAGMFFVQLAVVSGKVTVVSALTGLQYGLLVVFVFLLSKFLPKFFKEDYTKLEIAQEVGAVILIGFGLYLLI